MQFASDIQGDSAWSRHLRHLERAEEVRDGALGAVYAIPALFSAASRWESEHGVPLFALALTWAEGSPAHWLGPIYKPPTERPHWWQEAGLPERRHRKSGEAWTSASREASSLLFAALPGGLEALLPLLPEVLFPALQAYSALDAAYFAAAQAAMLHTHLRGAELPPLAERFYPRPLWGTKSEISAAMDLWACRAQEEGERVATSPALSCVCP